MKFIKIRKGKTIASVLSPNLSFQADKIYQCNSQLIEQKQHWAQSQKLGFEIGLYITSKMCDLEEIINFSETQAKWIRF